MAREVYTFEKGESLMGQTSGKRWRGWLIKGLVLIGLLSFGNGCDSSSVEIPALKATGLWQGTVGGEPVRMLVAPDGVYHMAIFDAGGNAVGEFSGQISVDRENVGRGWAVLRQGDTLAGSGDITFLLGAGQLSGGIELDGETAARPLQLQASADATRPAEQDDIEGRWSVTPENIVDLFITPSGAINGAVHGAIGGTAGGNCSYSGSAELLSADWNIYRLSLQIDTVRVQGQPSCQDRGAYKGLAILMGDPSAKRFWFTGSDPATGRTHSTTWQATQNVAPLAVVAEMDSQPVRALSGLTTIALDGRGSSDANREPLTYAWSGVDPGGNPLLFASATDATTTFIPGAQEGNYTVTLTVGDGQVETRAVSTVVVKLLPARFIDNGNGTVTDAITELVWHKDAGCFPQRSVEAATLDIAALASGTVQSCGLTDGSNAGDWHLPSATELASLVDKRFSTPALADTSGRLQWKVGDPFNNVAPGLFYGYWTSTPDPDFPTDNLIVNLSNGAMGGDAGVNFHAWPVRALRPDELQPTP